MESEGDGRGVFVGEINDSVEVPKRDDVAEDGLEFEVEEGGKVVLLGNGEGFADIAPGMLGTDAVSNEEELPESEESLPVVVAFGVVELVLDDCSGGWLFRLLGLRLSTRRLGRGVLSVEAVFVIVAVSHSEAGTIVALDASRLECEE